MPLVRSLHPQTAIILLSRSKTIEARANKEMIRIARGMLKAEGSKTRVLDTPITAGDIPRLKGVGG